MATEPGNPFERHFPNHLDDLNRVTEEALGFLQAQGVSEGALYLANLVIEEMGTNILKYGYSDAARHEIILRLEVQPESLVLAIEDDGHEFNPVTAPEPDIDLPPEERDPGGLGIHLIRKLADQMTYERTAGRNRLTVKIRL